MAQMNMQKMMLQAKRMQEEVEKAQEEVKLLEADGSAGGGVVKVVASGDGRIRKVSIAPEIIDPEDKEMLEDLVLAAANDALNNVNALAQIRMEAATGGFNIPGF